MLRSDEYERTAMKHNYLVSQALDYIESHYTEYDLSLDVLAQKLNVSTGHLCRVFKKRTGTNYKEYVTELRMKEAQNLLENPLLTLEEISKRIGYDSVSHFIKVFVRHSGMSPSRFRNEMLER